MKKLFNGHSMRTMLFLFGLFFTVGLVSAKAVTIYGVTTTNQLIRFDSATPTTAAIVGAITGLQTGENILGIDFRPANGQLYSVGSSSRLYTINLANGAATQIGTTGAFVLSGTDFGFDFNPTVDRIRVVSNTAQNLRLNPNDGSLAATDGMLNPGAAQVTAAAYTNNFAGATTTTLYDIDTATDSLYIQNPPNNGTLVLVGTLGVGDVTSVNGFDIAPGSGTAYAALTVGGSSRLYTINLTTGAATVVNNIGGANNIRGLAVSFGSAASGTTALDFDGDRRADYSVFRPGNTTWYINRSSANSTSSFFGVSFGLSTDVLTPGDYDGDGRGDISVWRPSNSTFYVLRSSDNTIQIVSFGISTDEPVARDYDGDGRTDFAVARRQSGAIVWYIINSSNNGIRISSFGNVGDFVAPGDYDGDGRFDLAVFRGADNQPAVFFVQRSGGGTTSVSWGLGSDLVVPGDYDGDGKTDYAVLRGGTQYNWFILRSSDNGSATINFGGDPQFPTQADYDGDGRTDISVWDPTTGIFYVLRSNSGNTAITSAAFGQNGDYPVANYDTH